MQLSPEVVGTALGLWYVYPHMALALTQLALIYFTTPIVNMLLCGDTNATAANC